MRSLKASARAGCLRSVVNAVQLGLGGRPPQAPPYKLSPCSHSCGRGVLGGRRPLGSIPDSQPRNGLGHRAQGKRDQREREEVWWGEGVMPT